MKIIHLLILLLSLLACTQKSDYELVWNDEFDYRGLPDSTKWSFDTDGNAWEWGSKQLQYYTSNRKENAFVNDGVLHIVARTEVESSRPYTSARLITKNKGDWKYGKIEVRAKVPGGRGVWPAIMMLPSDWEYGSWPASGEINIMEYVGYEPDSVYFTFHTTAYNHLTGTQKVKSAFLPDARDEYHTYTLEWTEDKCTYYLNEEKVFQYKKQSQSTYEEWPFDKRFYLIINLAVGGSWGGIHGVDNSIFPCEMEVDYVRVYQK